MNPPIRSLSSRDNPWLVGLRKLKLDPGAYRKQGCILLEGEHLCEAFLQRGRRPDHALLTEAVWEQQAPARRLADSALQVTLIPPKLMAELSALETASAVAFVVPWTDLPSPEPEAPTVVLDRLQDAGNVGTLLRSAAAFGFEQVIALKGTAALWSPKVLRAGMGAHFGLKLIEGADASVLEALRVPSLATSSHAAQAVHDVALPWPCAWVFGHEGQGVEAGLMNRCALSLRIAQPGGEESLNVSAAAAVCLYESARQRLCPS